MSIDTKRCAACNEIKSHSAFHANAKNKTDGLFSRT
jgi:hypothetical protein